MNKTFKVTVPRTYEFEEGWGVAVTPIFDGDEAALNLSVSDIEVEVVRIREGRVRVIGEVPSVPLQDANSWVPVENFQKVGDLTVDDTHDLRTRWFATEEEARAHAEYTEQRWRNPQPWEEFLTLS